MIKVIARDFIKPEHVDKVVPLYKELVEKTKLEQDCIEYNLFVDQENKSHFIFIEAWTDRAALDRHCQSEHFQRLVPEINQYQASPCHVLIMDAF